MCQERNKAIITVWDKGIKIDLCMKSLIEWLNNKHITVACCCGHGRYPKTVVVKEGITVEDKSMPTGRKNIIVFREILSGRIIPRIKRFYVKDEEGFYYIPETIQGDI